MSFVSISLENFNPGGDLEIFQDLGPLGNSVDVSDIFFCPLGGGEGGVQGAGKGGRDGFLY